MRLTVFLALAATTLASKQKIAVIGGGFTGASTAYYLNQLCEDCYEVTIFEAQDRLGGRVLHQKWPNSSLIVNAGGDEWSKVNTYLMQLMQELPIEEDTYPSRPYKTSGLYQGAGNPWMQMAVDRKTDPNYDSSALIIEKQVQEVQESLKLNYKERGLNLTTGKPYESIEEFVRFGGLELFTADTTATRLDKVDVLMINRTIIPACRDIYDQSIGLNSFAGMAVALSALTPAHSSKGGNDQVVMKLVEKSGANTFLSSTVETVSLQANDNGAGSSFYLSVNRSNQGPFDRVVLGAPFENAGVWNNNNTVTPIKWQGFSLPSFPLRKYQHWYVIWVEAKAANPEAFGLSSKDVVPDIALTMANSTAKFVKLAAEYDLENGNKAFRFFSNVPITNLDELFTGLTWNKTFHWPYTFPDLAPTSTFQPVKLHERIYYPNALESVAVAMEMGVIGGRNAAMQIYADGQNPSKK